MKTSTANEKKMAELDKKIEKLQEKVIKKHAEYDALTEDLQRLLEERYPERNMQRVKDALYKAYIDSEKSLEECIELILNPDITDYL